MFRPVIAVATASIALLALAGCSLATSTSTSTGKSGDTASAAPSTSDRTYTAADLTAIMTSIKKSTKSTGEIVTDAKLKALTAKSGGVASLLSQKGLSIEPATCADLITSKLPAASNGYGLGADSIGAALISPSAASLSVSSANGKQLPASVNAAMSTDVDSLLSTCGSMTMKFDAAGKSLAIGLKLSKFDVTTEGSQSLGLKEVLTIPGVGGKKATPLTINIVEARKGNLIVSATDPLGGATTATLVKQVNQVLDAAAALK